MKTIEVNEINSSTVKKETLVCSPSHSVTNDVTRENKQAKEGANCPLVDSSALQRFLSLYK